MFLRGAGHPKDYRCARKGLNMNEKYFELLENAKQLIDLEVYVMEQLSEMNLSYETKLSWFASTMHELCLQYGENPSEVFKILSEFAPKVSIACGDNI